MKNVFLRIRRPCKTLRYVFVSPVTAKRYRPIKKINGFLTFFFFFLTVLSKQIRHKVRVTRIRALVFCCFHNDTQVC